MGKHWSKEEIHYLVDNWNKVRNDEIVKELNRSYDSIMRKAKRIGLNVHKTEDEILKRKWTEEEDQLIINNYKNLTPLEISKYIKRSVSAIRKRAVYLGVAVKVTHWSFTEEEFLKERWGISNLNSIAKALNRSINAVKLKAYQMSLRQQINANGSYLTPIDVSSMLNINKRTLYSWIRNGLIKTRKFKVGKKTKYQISVDDFCKFIENNQNKWNSTEADITLIKCYYTSYSIYANGNLTIREEQYKWLEEKIKRDKEEYRKLLKPWTTKEEKELFCLLDKGYSYKEICIKLCRTMGSVKTKIYNLNNECYRSTATL